MKTTLFLIGVLVCSLYTSAQSLTRKAAGNAFMITRMADHFHVQPKQVNDVFSVHVYDTLLAQLDDEKIFFTEEDIAALLSYRYTLDEEVLQTKTDFLQMLSSRFEARLQQADTMIAGICKQPFDFTLNEKYTVAEDNVYPANTAVMRVKLSKFIKSAVLASMMEQKELLSLSNTQQKKYADSVEPFLRHKVQTLFQRSIHAILQSPGGVPQYVGDEYCKAVAQYYDPHTEYFPATEKEDFDSELGDDKLVFGLGLKDDDKEGVRIRELRPGSPAYKSGQLNTGDKIESIQWADRQPVDVSNASLDEVSHILSESNHDVATITVKKEDGTTRQVKMVKEKMEADEDDSKVKSFILKGSKVIGYISLPAFYTDYKINSDVKGCANDVAKEIIKLKQENIDGLILDIRYNGGGSMQEAVELAGIFIDAGPVEMIKDKGAKVVTLKDMTRGTIYDGPLLVMINGYSASASEMVAGTLQDYNRAVIMGSPSYGKATAQVVLPLDTTVILDKNIQDVQADSYIKMTVSQLYRVNGKTAQFTGVIPDIILPEVLDAHPRREADNPFALQPNTIDANKYYQPFPALPVSTLQAEANKEIQASAYFNRLNAFIANSKKSQQKTDVSLKIAEAVEQYKAAQMDTIPEENTAAAAFTIDNNTFEKQRLQAADQLAAINTAWKGYLQKDAYLKIAYDLLTKMLQ